MKRIAVGLAALVLLWGGAGQARSSFVVYTTFGPNDSYFPNGGTTVSGGGPSGQSYNATANGFTTQETVTLDQVRFAAVGTPGFLVDVLLASDDGSVRPGTILETLGQVSIQQSAMIFTLDSSTHSVLTAGDTYWLILQPHDPTTTDFAGWNTSSPPVSGLLTQKHSATGDWPSGGRVQAQSAFEVSGTPAAVPEPASLTLLGAGVAGLLGYGWQRRRRWPAIR